jgi:S1-C subfamily serine protease
LFATNYHVIEGNTELAIALIDGNDFNIFNAKVIIKDEINDIAIIKIDDDKFEFFKNLPYNIVDKQKIGENIFTLGFPMLDVMGTSIKYTEGSISSLNGPNDDIRFIQISAPIQPGNSGGPLFNKNNEIVGITTAKLNTSSMNIEVQNVNYALKSNYLLNLLKMLDQDSTLVNSGGLLTNLDQSEMITLIQPFVGIIISKTTDQNK